MRCLENEGVEYIFGIPGEENLAFLEALRTSTIRLILTRHEQAAGFMTACLRNPAANSLYTEEDRNISVFSDCADLPYVLRAYFSSKKRLPFSFHSSISGGRYTSGNTLGPAVPFLRIPAFLA